MYCKGLQYLMLSLFQGFSDEVEALHSLQYNYREMQISTTLILIKLT